MSFIKKLKIVDNILSDDINKKTRVLNNTLKVYKKMNAKMNILKSINSIMKSGKKSMIIRILMI